MRRKLSHASFGVILLHFGIEMDCRRYKVDQFRDVGGKMVFMASYVWRSALCVLKYEIFCLKKSFYFGDGSVKLKPIQALRELDPGFVNSSIVEPIPNSMNVFRASKVSNEMEGVMV